VWKTTVCWDVSGRGLPTFRRKLLSPLSGQNPNVCVMRRTRAVQQTDEPRCGQSMAPNTGLSLLTPVNTFLFIFKQKVMRTVSVAMTVACK
jgi:hypothetical protein